VNLSLGGLASAKLSGDETGVGGVIILGHGGKMNLTLTISTLEERLNILESAAFLKSGLRSSGIS
jgi:hypothetical protein